MNNKTEQIDFPQRKESVKCCATCPFLKQNFGKPTPNPESSDVDWFSKENMLRLWNNGLKHGEPMICHSSDADNKTYGGVNDISKGKEHLCYGSLIVTFKHLKKLEQLLNESNGNINDSLTKYKALAGKNAMPRKGLLKFAWMIQLGRTSLIGGLPIPINIVESREVCVQWDCKISNDQSIK